MPEWLTKYWVELVLGALIILVVRGDQLFRLIKVGRKQQRQEQDEEVDRRLKPFKERAESSEALARLRAEERDEAQAALTECVQARAALETKVGEQQKQLATLAPLQPEVMRMAGELEQLNDRLKRIENVRRRGRDQEGENTGS